MTFPYSRLQRLDHYATEIIRRLPDSTFVSLNSPTVDLERIKTGSDKLAANVMTLAEALVDKEAAVLNRK
jgi:hypothetical protein